MAGLLWFTTIICTKTVNFTVNMPPLSYTREALLQLEPTTSIRVPSDVYKTIRELEICSVKPTRRGHRSFLKIQQPISTIITHNRQIYTRLSSTRGVNPSNLRTLQNHDLAPTKLIVCLWNVQSLRNKSTLFTDYVLEHDIDVIIVTKLWLKPDEHVVIGEFTPPGCFLTCSTSCRSMMGCDCCAVQVSVKFSYPK